ncbi:MAG: carbohydrate-binding domain-containing protein [Sedimentisphaerales bacterium]|nr:carbohydrate-binding domain-containing protein [Sedimentisphaerales bacterium]
MSKRETMVWLACAFVFSLLAVCHDGLCSQANGDEQVIYARGAEGIITDALAENKGNHEDPEDYSWDDSEVIDIALNGTSITADTDGATVDGNELTITSAGTYRLTGILEDGRIIVDSNDKDIVRLILNGVDINCSTNAPIFVKKAEKTVIALAEDTENYLTDAAPYVYDDELDNEPNAAVFSKDDLTIFGDGALTVYGNYNDGISCKDGLIIASGTINVTAVDDGIRGKDYLVIYDGTITLYTRGDGLKSDNDKDGDKGYIYIEDGVVKISAAGDAIEAQTDVLIAGGELSLTSGGGSKQVLRGSVSAKGIKAGIDVVIDDGTLTISSADDAIHSNGSVCISGGTLDLASGDDGIHSDGSVSISGGTLNLAAGDNGIKSEVSITISTAAVSISKSSEGIESPLITIDSGNVSLVATDDGFNATYGVDSEANDGSCLCIYGGYIVVSTTNGDGLDSNGNIEITAGTIIVHGPQAQMEVGMDCNGTCNVTGGFLVISGTNSDMTEAPSTSSSQCSIKFMSNSQMSTSTLFHLEDAGGNNIVTFQPVHSYYSIIFSSPEIQQGSTYSIYTGGTSTGTVTDGLYLDGVYTPGTQSALFTVSGTVTNVGSSGTNPGPGNDPNPGDNPSPGGGRR